MAGPDALGGFHMVAALSQATVNYQFSQLAKQGVIHDSLDIEMADTGITLKARLAAPTVSLSLPDRHRSLLFMLNLQSGTFSYYEGFGPSATLHSVDFDDWVYAFVVDMDMQHLAQDQLKAGGAVPAVVQQHLGQFSDDLFSVRQLFLDFENADLAAYDRTHSRMDLPEGSGISPGQVTQFQQAIGNYFTSLKGTENPYVLGYCVEQQRHTGSEATFAPTGTTFSTLDDPKGEDLNALNFLLMTGGQPLPSDPNAGIFATNWVEQGDFDGTFVISRSLFIDAWLVPTLGAALDVGLDKTTDTGWELSLHRVDKFTVANGASCITELTKVDAHFTNTEDRTVTVGIDRSKQDRILLTLSGSLSMRQRLDVTCVLPEWMSETVTLTWTGSITIMAGADGRLTTDVTLDVAPVTKQSDGDFLGKADIALSAKNQQILNDVGSQFERSLRDDLTAFQSGLDRVQARFLLPAGDVFFFKNAQLTAERDLTLDISYLAEHP